MKIMKMTDERTFRRWGGNGSIANERILGSFQKKKEDKKVREERERDRQKKKRERRWHLTTRFLAVRTTMTARTTTAAQCGALTHASTQRR